MKLRTVSLFVLGTLLALLLTACSPASPASQPPEATSVVQPQAGTWKYCHITAYSDNRRYTCD